MSFLSPGAFALTVLIPIIVVMYLLRLRRTEYMVSSTYLWRRMVRDLEANAPWQRLHRNLLLLLQLLFLISLIFALARPFTWQQGISGNAVILIIDTSASMAAVDVAPSRIEAAKNQALRLAEDLPEKANFTIIDAGSKAQVLLSASQDRRQIRQTIEDIHAGTAGADMTVALQIASAIAAPQTNAQIIVLSDGGVTLPARLAVPGSLYYYPIGIRGENQAISLLTVEPNPGTDSLSAFTQITNYGKSLATRRLAIYTDNNLANAYDLQLQPGEQTAILIDGISTDTQVIEARLLPPEDETIDDLILDDRALAVTRNTKPSRITLVSRGNRFLETALSLLPNTEFLRITPGTETTYPEADLTIFDVYTPITETLPIGNLFYIGPLSSTEFFTITGKLENPKPLPAELNDPLLNNVYLDQVAILDSAQIPLPNWAQPVIIADGTGATPDNSLPLLFAGEVNERRLAVLTFGLQRSDLPLQLAFPILLVNLIEWMAPGPGADIPTQITPGEPLTLSKPVQEPTELSITPPNSPPVNLSTQNGFFTFADTHNLGLYKVAWREKDEPESTVHFLAVNLFSPAESSTAPNNSLPIPGFPDTASSNVLQNTRHEWWREIAAVSLLLLMIEWLYYRRAAVFALSHQLRMAFVDRMMKR